MKVQPPKKCPCGLTATSNPQIVKGATIGVITEYYEDPLPLELIRRELAFAGVQVSGVSFTTLWQHIPPDIPENEKCSTWNVKQAIAAVKGCKIVLLVGPDASAFFLATKVSEVMGTWQESRLLPDAKVLPVYNPTSLIHGTLGEWRLAMQRLKDELSLPSSKSSKTPKKATGRR